MTIITVRNLSKTYRLGATVSYDTLRETIAHTFKGLVRFGSRPPAASPRDGTLWALRDVSFDVREGEVLGIIGRNGAGKSTLLKILSRITEPSGGEARIRGRVGSLLEVGTGFHQELSGRENIFLNGAILGMRKDEIRRKFDEIVAFADVERFLDTPVKRYSSGMYVRLAFAVAAHLEPEILIVDEVLAVGDLEFQKKCLGKMGDVAKGGRTVLFVSHNMAAVGNLCSRVCVLRDGALFFDGGTEEGIAEYCSYMMPKAPKISLGERTDRRGSGVMKIVSFQLLDAGGQAVEVATTGKDHVFRFEYEARTEKIRTLDFAFTVRDIQGYNLFRNRSVESGLEVPRDLPPRGYIDCRIPRFPLTAGRYAFGFRLIANGLESDYVTGPHAAHFDVIAGDYFGTGSISSHAPLVVDHTWSWRDPEEGTRG